MGRFFDGLAAAFGPAVAFMLVAFFVVLAKSFSASSAADTLTRAVAVQQRTLDV